MHYDRKGLIILSTFDLDLAAKCPFSMTLSDLVYARKECVRCNAFSKIARYCLKRTFKGTNVAGDKTLKKLYKNILLDAGVSEERSDAMIRKDSGILADLSYFSLQYKDSIDQVEPEICVNFGSFSIRDTLDAILCLNGEYYITKFMCDDHKTDDRELLRYEAIAGSLWIRETYEGIDYNGVCFVQLNRTHDTIMRQIDMTPPTKQLRGSIKSIIDYLEPTKPIKSLSGFNIYKQQELSKLPIRFGHHCYDCQACFKF